MDTVGQDCCEINMIHEDVAVSYTHLLALGLSILIVAIFPVGGLMFLVAMLLIACGVCCLKR